MIKGYILEFSNIYISKFFYITQNIFKKYFVKYLQFL